MCVDCTKVVYTSTGPNSAHDGCICTPPYQWSWVNLTGSCICDPSFEITIAASPYCFDCSNTVHGPGTANTTTTCNCNATFYWNTTSNTCECPPTMLFDNSTQNCDCNTATSAIISGICVDCTQILNNTGPNNLNNACTC